MDNKFLIKVATGIMVSLLFLQCKKNQLGGKAEIKGRVFHHAKAIANASIFIKFDTKDFPGDDTTRYDEKIKADAQGNYTLKVYKGTYFLYSVGKDFDIPSPYYVKGGTSVSIRNREKLDVDLAITE